MAIIYIKILKSKNIFYKIFNILKVKTADKKKIIYLPVNTQSSNKRIKRVIKKLCKYLNKNNINSVVI